MWGSLAYAIGFTLGPLIFFVYLFKKQPGGLVSMPESHLAFCITAVFLRARQPASEWLCYGLACDYSGRRICGKLLLMAIVSSFISPIGLRFDVHGTTWQ
jgi:hypothetical protein